MFLAAIGSLAVAALTTLFTTRTEASNTNNHASHNADQQVVTGRYTQYNGTTLRFIN
jgi:hypothetical protein